MERVQTLLRNHDIRPSYTRMAIYRYLDENRNHPTVEAIHEALSASLPTLSKTTVYNTLHLFIRHHLVKEIDLQDHKRYDIVQEPHAHFKCDVCDTLYDIDIVPPNAPTHDDIVDVRDVQLVYHGTCKRCQQAV